jgi:hypothetical protein
MTLLLIVCGLLGVVATLLAFGYVGVVPLRIWPGIPLRRLRCFVSGHIWRTRRTNISKHLGLLHLHSRAGQDADCDYCGAEWRDFYGFGITPENEHLCRRYSAYDATPALELPKVRS